MDEFDDLIDDENSIDFGEDSQPVGDLAEEKISDESLESLETTENIECEEDIEEFVNEIEEQDSANTVDKNEIASDENVESAEHINVENQQEGVGETESETESDSQTDTESIENVEEFNAIQIDSVKETDINEIDEVINEDNSSQPDQPSEDENEMVSNSEVENLTNSEISNIDEIVALSEEDLKAEEETRKQAEIMKPIIEKETRRQKLLSEKEKIKDSGSSEDGGDGEDFIIEKSVATVMHESMIPYSEFVILDRALPRVEDGLKPVQRRILYAMNDLGLTPDKPFRKSAGIVGECLGKYHPHGDTSVYDAMVRMAQPFNMNMPLVLGQGNFGSDDGDPPAAIRYTEAKLTPLSLELLRDLEKETVPYSLTYDDRNTEPDILPARYPNLLTNGTSGIAVGLATNIPPHNLAEVIDAHIAFIDDNKISLKQVLKIIKGPDFPTAGWITTDSEMIRAYETGRGKVVMSGKVHIEVDGDKRNIVITELPYQVNKVQLQKNIADLRENKKGDLQNITEIRDESDRNGMRIIVKLKKDTDAKKIVEQLYKYTQLRCNFNYNMVAIADGKPKQLGLLQMIEYYVNYQRQVVYKRSVFELNQAKELAHILEGLLVAIKNIDEVIKIIKTSKNTSEARVRLEKRFNLSEKQAQAILDLRLARLTNLEVIKVEEELTELHKIIDKLTAIIASKKLQFDVVKAEMLDIKKRFKIDRRTSVVTKMEDILITADDDEVPVEDIVVTITANGNIKRLSKKHFSMSNTSAVQGMRETDVNVVAVVTQTDKMLHIFTNLGKCYKLFGSDISECKLKDKGIPFKKLFPSVIENEVPVAVYPVVVDTLPDYDLVWLSRTGMIKRSKFADACGILKSVFDVYKIRDDRNDEIVCVQQLKKDRTILMITNVGSVLNATTGDVPVQGRIAAGVKGIQMDDSAWLAGISTAEPNGYAVLLTNHGNVKKVDMKNIDKMARYRKGLSIASDLQKNEEIIFASYAKNGDDLIAKTDSGELLVQSIEKLQTTARTGKLKNIFGKQIIEKGFIHRSNFVSPDC